MANITLWGASYSDVPAVELPQTGGGTVTFYENGGGATQHTIHLEFSDSTDTDIEVDYDDSLIATMITAYAPNTWTYNAKTVVLAELDGVEWYNRQSIPIGVELIDYTKAQTGYAINSSGVIEQGNAWDAITDYTPIDASMTFAFKCMAWYYIGFYDASKNVVSVIEADDIATSIEGSYALGTLSSSNIPSTAAYVILAMNSYNMQGSGSLIRTA